MDYRALYDTNEDFKGYVGRYAKQRNLSVGGTLKCALVQEAGKYYEKNAGGKNEDNRCRI